MKTGVEPDPESTSDGPGTTDLDGDSLFQINSLSAGAHRVGPGPVSYTHLTLPTTPYV